MVNLLFISNSIKIDAIKKALQPLLKVKIDIVADFDYGLKDVFEKRPATVFIQDHIAGVTGESVARHIQMLLGAGAPTFIFMHEGSPKAKPIKGLFEYLIDLTQTEVKIVTDIQATLKSLLGPQWEKIYIPPSVEQVAIKDVAAASVGIGSFADQLVDDFISDLENLGSVASGSKYQSTDISEPVAPLDEPFHVVSSTHDQLAEMLSETVRESGESKTTTVKEHDVSLKKPLTPENLSVSTLQKPQPAFAKYPEMDAGLSVSVSAQPKTPTKENVSAVPFTMKKSIDSDVSLVPLSLPENPAIQKSSPADFVISGEKPAEDLNPEELLRVFEDNYYSSTGGWKRYVILTVVMIICAGGGYWYLQNQKPQLLAYIYKPSGKSVVVTPVVRPVVPAIIQKPETPPAQKAETLILPSFIPQAGVDSSFASQKPGWERYVGNTLEFRVYRSAGKIKALQVLGGNKHDISEPKLKSILLELLGDGEYRVKSREQKLGYYVSRATAGQKAELLIYRKKSAIRAFVVSID